MLEFDIVYVTQKAIKGSVLADYLAQQAINDYQPMHLEFPYEDIMTLFEEEVENKDRDKWIVWFDGASNTLGHGVGAVLVTPDDQCIPFMARLSFDCTNKMITLQGRALLSSLQLRNLVDMWLQTVTKNKIQTSVGSSAKDFIMVLSYGRKT